MKSTAQRTVRRVSLRITEGMDLFLKENEDLFLSTEWHGIPRLRLQDAMQRAFQEGLLAIVEDARANPERTEHHDARRLCVAPGPGRLWEYEERIRDVERTLAALP